MTELIEEPQFKVGACVTRYIESRGIDPDAALIDQRSHDYLSRSSLIHTEENGTFSLNNSAGVTLKVYRIEEISPRKRAKLEAIGGIPLYLCQTGIWGRIKTRSIRSYNLENTTSNLGNL